MNSTNVLAGHLDFAILRCPFFSLPTSILHFFLQGAGACKILLNSGLNNYVQKHHLQELNSKREREVTPSRRDSDYYGTSGTQHSTVVIVHVSVIILCIRSRMHSRLSDTEFSGI